MAAGVGFGGVFGDVFDGLLDTLLKLARLLWLLLVLSQLVELLHCLIGRWLRRGRRRRGRLAVLTLSGGLLRALLTLLLTLL